MTTSIQTVAVIGTGVIGSSWTALFLSRGLHVIVSDPVPDAKSKLAAYLQKEMPTLEKMGLADGASISNYKFVENIDEHLPHVDIVQENAPEKLEFKRKLIAKLDARTREDVIIASSSSSIPSSQFISDCQRNPNRVLIGHPFNPPHLIPLVEVVPHPQTDEKYSQQAMEFYHTTVAAGLGLRWALTGPFMTNILGGGGGKTSFKKLLEHLAPAAQGWTKDMNEHSFDYSEESLA
ncbi:L-carnitine dehydrogenase [Lachnellula suecica]|uniref:L-carnitine dehydrogenase n=1 Tax=Lachnellula suecica TaxID=602035 RepID=A0A8T9C0V8_9HELO|nr:L-carnitine dehydrogenase [Lachnellula suecica]